MNTTSHNAAPAITAEIAALMDDLTGFHPALDRVVSGLGDLLIADLNATTTQGLIAALGALPDGSLTTLVGLTLRHLANPDANPALAALPASRQQTLRRSGAEYAAAVSDPYTQALAADAAAAIDAD